MERRSVIGSQTRIRQKRHEWQMANRMCVMCIERSRTLHLPRGLIRAEDEYIINQLRSEK